MGNKIKLNERAGDAKGIIEFVIKDSKGNIVSIQEENIVKIFAKEMLSHRLPSTEAWSRTANTGTGGWTARNADSDEEFAPRYILLGASYDATSLVPLDTNDSRFYTQDAVTGKYEPIRLGPGAEYDGGLINAIPLAEPDRPLLRIEDVKYEATYQPAGTPLLESDVRAINNIVLLESTIAQDEYNGFGITNSDFFTITEVALAGGKKIDSVTTCELTPRELFLEGSTSGDAILVNYSGTDVISIDPSESQVDLIKEGDQIKLVEAGGTVGASEELDQVNPYYLVTSKQTGGRDIQLDRVPVDSTGTPLASGSLGVFRDTLRIFSHRLLSSPVRKSSDYEILVRWRLIFS